MLVRLFAGECACACMRKWAFGCAYACVRAGAYVCVRACAGGSALGRRIWSVCVKGEVGEVMLGCVEVRQHGVKMFK